MPKKLSPEHLAAIKAGFRAYWNKRLAKRNPKPPKVKRTKEELAEEKRQRLLANPINPKGGTIPEERRLRIKATCATSEKYRANIDKLLSDPERGKKIAKTLAKIRAKKNKEKQAKKKREKVDPRCTIGRLIAVDGAGKPRYSATWVSPVDPTYQVKVATSKVIKHGRPRDPLGNFMNPKHPEHIFGLPIRNGDPVVHPPNSLQNGVSEPARPEGVDGKDPAAVGGVRVGVGDDSVTPERLYRRYHKM